MAQISIVQVAQIFILIFVNFQQQLQIFCIIFTNLIKAYIMEDMVRNNINSLPTNFWRCS